MAELCDLRINVNGQQTFFLNEKVILKFSGKLRKFVRQEKKRAQIKNSVIQIDDFPGGPFGFELVSRFCYNNGTSMITVSNVCLLYCCAVFLEMNERVSALNLLHRTETFLKEMSSWSQSEILTSLVSCESIFAFADASGLIEKLLNTLLAKIAQNSDIFVCLSSSSSSPEATASPFRLSSSTKSATPEVLGIKRSSSRLLWWFDELTILPPIIIERFVKLFGAHGTNDSSLLLTRFILNYLKTRAQSKHCLMIKTYSKLEYSRLADTAVYGVISTGQSSFSCRGLFWILRLVSAFGISRDCRTGLESLIGSVLDQATLDDLLVSANDGHGVYDVNLVVRLVRVFVYTYSKEECLQKIKKVGWLVDKYIREIAPDQNLKISRFLRVAESLTDCARDCFDGVYRAVDIYLESHPCLTLEERSRLCRCLNYNKLSLETCKELAKNPRIPPRVAVEALAAQSCRSVSHNIINSPPFDPSHVNHTPSHSSKYHHPAMINVNIKKHSQMALYRGGGGHSIMIRDCKLDAGFKDDQEDMMISVAEENEMMRMNLERMQWKVMELEKVCKGMKGQMSRMGKSGKSPLVFQAPSKAMPRFC